MHELSIAISIVEMAQEEAALHGLAQVHAVHLRLGLLSGVVKQALLSSYEIACEATPLEGSQLLIEEVPVEVAAKLTLALAIFKFDRMEWAIEKCTELGVARIVPLVTRRTDPHLAAAAVKRRDRWQRLAAPPRAWRGRSPCRGLVAR